MHTYIDELSFTSKIKHNFFYSDFNHFRLKHLLLTLWLKRWKEKHKNIELNLFYVGSMLKTFRQYRSFMAVF